MAGSAAEGDTRPLWTLAAGGLMNFALGSLYAWSVFLEPFEARLGAARSDVSAVFSLAVACFIAAMLFGPYLYRYLRAPWLVALTCTLAGSGLALSAWSGGLTGLALGYGVLFGAANGLGYGLSLQLVISALPGRRGLATGIVVAAYALGAVLLAPVFTLAIKSVGLAATLSGLAAFFAAVALFVIAALTHTGAELPRRVARGGDGSATGSASPGYRTFAIMWAGFSLGSTAGLMLIGHAAGIVAAYGGSERAVVLGPVFIAAGNGLGRIGAGWLSDRLPVRRVLAGAAALAGLVLLLLALVPRAEMALAVLCGMGLAYGAMAAGYPVAVAHYYGVARVGPVYGRLITAWGAGGIAGPWLAGVAFDRSGGYGGAVAIAIAAAALALIANLALPRHTQA